MITRRQMIKASSAAFIGGILPLKACAAWPKEKNKERIWPFRIAINTSTISGYKLPVEQQIELCVKAGYEGIELWVRDVQAFIDKGGKVEDLASQIKGSGMQLDNMIGFAPWMTGEEGMEEMKKEMELSARLGSKCIAATCFGLDSYSQNEMPVYSEKYRELIEFGEELNIIPLIELWGHRALSRLTDVTTIALGAHHRKASLLLDFYHLYRGGNSFESLALLNGKNLPVFHINDYPGNIPYQNLKDADRVLPGDGVCPYQEILPILYENGFRGALSLELFNASYWEKYSAEELLRIGYEKVAEVVQYVTENME
jgi:2-keto-myo-inositol isomerase